MIEVVFDGRGAPNSRPFHVEIDPISATVGVNGFYEADTWDLEFDARQLPFDPDQVAYCAAQIYMWDSRKNLERSEWAVEENLMIKGLVDDIETDIVGEDNVVKFTGRDYTAILADPEWDPKDRVKAGGLLNDVVQSIADEAAPEGTRARFNVVWIGEKDPPRCGGLGRSTKKKGLWVKPGKTYWEVIWDLCIQHAYVPHIEGSTIYIGEPVTQTRQSLLSAPRLVYGQCLTSLNLKRKFSREKVPQIALVAWDPKNGRKIEVKYPKRRNIIVQATANRNQARDALGIPLTVKKDEVMYFPAPKGVTDPEALERYARMRFYHLGRGETVYRMTTSHLWIDASGPSETNTDINGRVVADSTEVNLLRLRPGIAIGIQFDPFNREHLRSLEYGQRVEHIQSLGYQQQIAQFVASNVDRMELFNQNYYYNRGTISYDHKEGIEIEIEATNFASEVREIQFAEAA